MASGGHWRRLATCIATVVAVAVAVPASAGAALFVVNDTGDGVPAPGDCPDGGGASPCSLRDAVSAANADPGTDTIRLQPGTTYNLTRSAPGFEDANDEGDLDVTDAPLTIEGNGATINGSQLAERERVLDVNLSGAATTVTITDLTITGGRAFQPGASTPGPGAGINLNGANATTTLDRVWLKDNEIDGSVSTSGAGLAMSGGAVDVRNSLISGNVAFAGTFNSNAGGIAEFGGTLTLTNSTVTGNKAPGVGGGVFVLAGTLNLRNATIAGNESPSSANLRRNASTSGSAINTIVAAPVGGPNCDMNGQSWSPSLGNLDSSSGTCNFGSGNIAGADPLFRALADNGGPTMTMALSDGSPAIDAGSTGGSDCPATDQRGSPRPTDGNGDGTAACDIGAFEAPGKAPPGPGPGGGGVPPDVTPPVLTVTRASRQDPLRRRNALVFKATSSENGTIVARGTLDVPGSARVFRFESVTRVVSAGRTVTIKLLVPRKALRRVKSLLNRGKRLKATATFTATDAAGNKSAKKTTVKLVRRRSS